MMENVYKIKLKLENIWIDLIRGIYAPYNFWWKLVHERVSVAEDVTLFPDQDIIHNDMAGAAYCSKLNMSKAYEQIHIVLEHP